MLEAQSPLNEKQIKDRCIPGGGTFFFRQDPMLALHRSMQGSFPVAWDVSSSTTGAKVYGVYPTARDFFEALVENKQGSRWGYELIPENTPVKGYMDIEWVGEADTDHEKITEMMQDLRKKLVEYFKHQPAIYVCCSSRPVDKSYKNSYHITVENIVFQNNHDGQMLRFFDMENKDIWCYTNEKGECVPAFDKSVYSRNRCIRLPLCSKKGSSVPFIRVSADPFEDEFNVEIGEEDIDELIPFVLTNPPDDGDHFMVSLAIPVIAVQKKQKVANIPQTVSAEKKLPFSTDIVIEILMERGDTVSTVTKVTWKAMENQWQIQCDQKKRQRKCLHNALRYHVSNNCLLFVNKCETPCSYRVEYHCRAGECQFLPNLKLGMVSMEDDEWKFVNESIQKEPDEEVDPSLDPDMEVDVDVGDPTQNQYDLVKARFEKKHFKVLTPTNYAQIESNVYEDGLEELGIRIDSLFLRNRGDVLDYTGHVYYFSKNSDDAPKKKFGPIWLSDQYIKRVDRIVYDYTIPHGFVTNKGRRVYNEWPGFIADRLPPVSDEQVVEDVKPFVKHILDVFAQGNMDHAQFIIKWFAHIIQRPTKKTELVLVLFGAEGCGKNAILDPIRECVMGTYCAEQTGDAEAEVFAKHSTATENKLLVQIDELTRLRGTMDRFKNMVTAKKTKVEKKFTAITQVKNYVNYIITTNNQDAIKMAPGEGRRFALFRCSDMYHNNDKYFKTLVSHLRTPRVARSIYQYLKGYDISDIANFQVEKPVTEFLREIYSENIPIVPRFLSALANEGVQRNIQVTTMFKECEAFALTGKYTFNMSDNVFAKHLRSIFNGVTQDRSKNFRFYTVSPAEWIVILKQKNCYDPYAEIWKPPESMP